MYCDTFWLHSFGSGKSSLPNARNYVLLYSFCFFLFLWFLGQFPSTSPWGLCLEGQFNGEFFCIASLGSLSYMYFEALIYGGAYFRKFVVTEIWQQLTPILGNTLYWSSEEWSSQLWVQFMQLCKKPEKSLRTSMGFEPVTSRYQCDAVTNWAINPLMLGAGQYHAFICFLYDLFYIRSSITLFIEDTISWSVRCLQ